MLYRLNRKCIEENNGNQVQIKMTKANCTYLRAILMRMLSKSFNSKYFKCEPSPRFESLSRMYAVNSCFFFWRCYIAQIPNVSKNDLPFLCRARTKKSFDACHCPMLAVPGPNLHRVCSMPKLDTDGNKMRCVGRKSNQPDTKY
jgi:hypothetical protein